MPMVGEWDMLVWKKTVVAGCPYRAFPAEVINVDKAGVWVTMRADPSLLMLDEPGCTYDWKRLTQVLEKPRRVRWSQYHQEILAVAREEVSRRDMSYGNETEWHRERGGSDDLAGRFGTPR